MPQHPFEHTAARADRDSVLYGRLARSVFTGAEDVRRYYTDTETHDRIELMYGLLKLADRAMEAEGVDRAARDRVAHWLIFGQPPSGHEQDPDAEADRAAGEQMQRPAEWETATMAMMRDKGLDPLLPWTAQGGPA